MTTQTTGQRIKEIACLCGARETDTGQERPRECWGCGERTMGQFNSGGAMLGVGEGGEMSRYFVQRRKQPVRASDDWEPIGNAWHIPAVADHEAADTGLLNMDGDPIMRAPNEMGFVWTSTGNHNSEGE